MEYTEQTNSMNDNMDPRIIIIIALNFKFQISNVDVQLFPLYTMKSIKLAG